MLFEQRLRICQESEHACGRGMGTDDHCRSWAVRRLRVRVHLPSDRRRSPYSTLGFFRNSAQGPSLYRPNFLRITSQQMSLLAVSRRAAWRATPRSTRSVVVDAAPKEWTAKREAVIHHAKGVPCPPTSPEVEGFNRSPSRHHRPLAQDQLLWLSPRKQVIFYPCRKRDLS